MWSGVSQIRGELVTKAKAGVEGAYLFQGVRPQKVRKIVLWLLGEDLYEEKDASDNEEDCNEGTISPFMCGDVDVKVSSIIFNFFIFIILIFIIGKRV